MQSFLNDLKNIIPMKVYIKIVFCAIVMILSVSCEKHLDVPPSSSITAGSFWNSKEDLQIYLTGIYRSYKNLRSSANGFFDYSEGRADLVGPGQRAFRLADPEHLHTQSALLGTGSWTGFYTLIHHCNLLLKQGENFKEDFTNISEYNDIIAQTKVLRAMVYFDLARIYGDVPMTLEPTESVPTDRIGRSSKVEIINFVKNEVNSAIGLFGSEVISNRLAISKIAAYAFKADVYMWSGRALNPKGSPNSADLNEAIAAINAVEASGQVSWVEDYAEVFPNGTSPAHIFSIYYDIDEGGNSIFSRMNMQYSNTPQDVRDANPNGMGDTPISGPAGTGLNSIKFTDELVAMYDQDNDARFKYNCHFVQEFTISGKFRGRYLVDQVRRVFDDDIPIYRYADLILLKAEALNDLGMADKAITELNRTRNRAGIGDYLGPADQLSVETEILTERARELCFENKRWWDLIRAHRIGEFVERYNENRGDDERFIYWPISESLIAQNDQLTQTEGY